MINKFAKARKLFPHTKNVVYFNSASYGPFSKPLHDIITKNLDQRMAAERDDSHETFAVTDYLRREYGKLIAAPIRSIGIGMNTSYGLNIAAFGLPLKRGDEILVSDVEFPASAYTWRAVAEKKGLILKFLKSKDRCFDIEEFERRISKRTRVLSLSYVQFFNGYKNDLKRISEICQVHSIVFVIDGIQGMGVEPINVCKLGIDIFTSGCQKWMLSPQGCGFFYLSDEIRERLEPFAMSWLSVEWKMKFDDLFSYDRPYFDSARKFEMGYFGTLNLLAMKASVDIIKNLGVKNIQKHNHWLIDKLAKYIEMSSFYTVTSSMDKKHRSSIFTFSCKRLKELHRFLLKERFILVRREGSIRVSVHLFNNEADIDKLIDCLDSFSHR